MAGIDLSLLSRIDLPSRPILQRIFAVGVLMPNYAFLPGVKIDFEGVDNLPTEPVIVAVNHTDRYGYFPLAYKWWRDFDRYFAAWAKGKYFESAFLSKAMQMLGAIPTVSRGYIIVRDFRSVLGRNPDENEYRALRDWVNAAGRGEDEAPKGVSLPLPLLEKPRNILGYDFDPSTESWARAVNGLYTRMMLDFMEIHRRSFQAGRDLMIFPEGTRNLRLGVGRSGIAQIALHLGLKVLPVGANGSDKIYPGACPLARRGRVLYRIGKAITPVDFAPYKPTELFVPFTPVAEARHGEAFERATSLVMDRLNDLLDPEYRRDDESAAAQAQGVERFI